MLIVAIRPANGILVVTFLEAHSSTASTVKVTFETRGRGRFQIGHSVMLPDNEGAGSGPQQIASPPAHAGGLRTLQPNS